MIGGLYMMNNYGNLANPWALNTFPKSFWIVLGLLQVLFAVGLVVPKVTAISAIYLALISLLGLTLYAAYAGFPGMLWALLPAVLLIFIAYGRKI
jgi:hypothetical protein